MKAHGELFKLVDLDGSNSYNNNNNTSNKRNPRTQSQEKFAAFNIKQQRAFFLELNYKKGKKT